MRHYLKTAFFFFSVLNVFSIDFNVKATPAVVIPSGDSSSLYTPGGGISLNAGVELLDNYTAGPELGYCVIPLDNTGTSASVTMAGAGAGFFLYPYSRMALLGNISSGIYQFKYEELSYSDIWWKIYGEAGFRLSPNLIISAGAGYLSLNASGGPLYTGIVTGISGKLSFQSTAAAGKVDYSLDQIEPVFPLLYGIYKQNSIGTLRVVNNETAEIRNVRVSFGTANYTSSTMVCGSSSLMKRGESADFPLYADFSESIQNFTENGMIPGDLIITYDLLGEERTERRTLTIQVYNRNTMRWTDSRIIASYISPNSPEVLDFSKYIVGIARNNLKSGLNRNMQFAIYLFNGLKTGGITHSGDEITPYAKYHRDPELLDYVQYPFQTLSYKLGDYDDLGLLYAASLESAGISAAMIPLEKDFIVAFRLDINSSQAQVLFNDTGKLLEIDGQYWIPLSLSVMKEGFINSWYRAVSDISSNLAEGKNMEFIILQEAWKTYPPSGIRGQGASFQKPEESSVVKAFETDLSRYIASEFGPKIKKIQDEISSGGGSVQLYNELGLLFVRAGMYNEAREEFLKSAGLDSTTAMVNLGNIELIEKKYQSAADWYRKALELQPDSKPALAGLDRIEALIAE